MGQGSRLPTRQGRRHRQLRAPPAVRSYSGNPEANHHVRQGNQGSYRTGDVARRRCQKFAFDLRLVDHRSPCPTSTSAPVAKTVMMAERTESVVSAGRRVSGVGAGLADIMVATAVTDGTAKTAQQVLQGLVTLDLQDPRVPPELQVRPALLGRRVRAARGRQVQGRQALAVCRSSQPRVLTVGRILRPKVSSRTGALSLTATAERVQASTNSFWRHLRQMITASCMSRIRAAAL